MDEPIVHQLVSEPGFERTQEPSTMPPKKNSTSSSSTEAVAYAIGQQIPEVLDRLAEHDQQLRTIRDDRSVILADIGQLKESQNLLQIEGRQGRRELQHKVEQESESMARKLAQVSESIRGEMQELRDIMRRGFQELARNGGEKFGPDGTDREKPGNQRTIDQIPPIEKLKGTAGEPDSAKGGGHEAMSTEWLSRDDLNRLIRLTESTCLIAEGS
ncbi:unnamed protein product [Linum trigynum]|uniref:Uncharacterized protein n=1 Tax=Linum trigynum TaxID=586398 RepID=A0AAV2DUM2_9ROSI